MKFEEYYQQYLLLHKNKWTKALHMVGNLLTLVFIFSVIFSSISNPSYLFLLVLSPFIVYPTAWISHFFIEKNEPAAFSNPLWAKLSDWRMMYDLLTRKIKWDGK